MNFSNNYINMLSIVNMGVKTNKLSVKVKFSKFNLLIIKFLYKKGFFRGFFIKDNSIFIFLKYVNGKNVISSIDIISKPNTIKTINFKYLKQNSLRKGLTLVSTSKGLMSLSDCIFYKENGIILFKIF